GDGTAPSFERALSGGTGQTLRPDSVEGRGRAHRGLARRLWQVGAWRVLVRQFREVDSRRTRRIDLEHGSADGRERGAEVVLRLHAEQPDLAYIYPVHRKICDVIHRLPSLGHDHVDIAGPQHG